MRRRGVVARPKRPSSQGGFSLVEVLVAGLVLVVGLIMISQFFASAAARVLDSDIRSVLHQIATEELESIRGLEYTDVGTVNGWPQGPLLDDEERVVDNLTVQIHREIVYWTDESYEGPYPANYRRVTVGVSATGHEHLAPVEVVSNVAGGEDGGTLLVRAQDSQGNPVGSVQLRIENDELIPNIDIYSSAIRTNSEGIMMVPGLPVDDDGNYVVSGTKPGYNSDSKTEFPVLDGVCQEVVLTMDKLSSMVVRVVDATGTPVEGLAVSVAGPQGYATTLTSTADGVTLSDLCFSIGGETYIVSLLDGQGYHAVTQQVAVPADSTVDVTLTVEPDGGVTTTTDSTTTTTDPSGTTTTSDPSATTTTTSSTTTTTTSAGTGSLHLTVRDANTNWPVRGAWVSLEGEHTGGTNRNGMVFLGDLELRTYEITITANYYETYTGTVTISGNETMTVYMTWDWSPPTPH